MARESDEIDASTDASKAWQRVRCSNTSHNLRLAVEETKGAGGLWSIPFSPAVRQDNAVLTCRLRHAWGSGCVGLAQLLVVVC